jgi:hypothetical protein
MDKGEVTSHFPMWKEMLCSEGTWKDLFHVHVWHIDLQRILDTQNHILSYVNDSLPGDRRPQKPMKISI